MRCVMAGSRCRMSRLHSRLAAAHRWHSGRRASILGREVGAPLESGLASAERSQEEDYGAPRQ